MVHILGVEILLFLTNKILIYKIINREIDILVFGCFTVVRCTIKEENMAKESKHRKEGRKKAQMTLKERRTKKHEKKQHKHEHHIDEHVIE